MKFIVFGLGIFGKSLSVRLTELGHEVIAIDKNAQKVEQLKEKITHTVCMDSTDREAVSALPMKDADAVIVAIGEDEASSLLTAALLKQLKIKRIIGRVVSDLQKTVLEAMQIDDYVLPEEESAEKLAIRLSNKGVVDSFTVSERYSIIEIKVPEKYVGKTLEEVDFPNKYQVIVLTTLSVSKRSDEGITKITKRANGLAMPETLLNENDIMVLFGEMRDITKLMNNAGQ